MKKFKYRLEKVLQVRLRLKDEALRELMLKRNELTSLQNKEKELIEHFLKNGIQDGAILTQADLIMTSSYSARLKEMIADTGLKIIEAQKAVDEATGKYVAASKEAKVLETHKEKKVVEYREAFFKDQEQFLDELATQRAARKVIG